MDGEYNSSDEDSIVHWIGRLRGREEEAAQVLWERYFRQLVELAGRRLPAHIRREFDEEDIALSAFHSMCRGVQLDRFPDLNDRNNLWALLVVITARKVNHQIRRQMTLKRGGGRVSGESILAGPNAHGAPDIDQLIGDIPSPEFAMQVADFCEVLFAELDDPELEKVAQLKMEGMTNTEVAERLGCAKRTVERRLSLIRRIWSESEGQPPQSSTADSNG